MAKYFRFMYVDDYDFGVAYHTFKQKGVLHLPYEGRVESWTTPKLELREGGFADYLATNWCNRLCSKRLRDILQDAASAEDELQWLDVEVYNERESRPYAILHFPHPPDVLNMNKTIHSGDVIIKPVFSKAKLGNRRIFCYPLQTVSFFVADSVKRAVEAAGCTGMGFSPARVD
jgi:hypothetical protein